VTGKELEVAAVAVAPLVGGGSRAPHRRAKRRGSARNLSVAPAVHQPSPPGTADKGQRRHHENRDVLLLLVARVPVQGYHFWYASTARVLTTTRTNMFSAQRRKGLPVLQVKMPQELQDEA
jgi:hypothetical protein